MSSSAYYKLMVFSILTLLLASCGSKKSAVSHTTKSAQDDVIEYGKKYLNKPYRYAGKGPNSFDCSGYTSFVFRKFGYNLNSSSAGQARQGEAINKRENLTIGDLVFFEGSRRNGRVGHVGIVNEIAKNGRFTFIHSSTSNGVIISSSEEPYYRSRYLRGGRIIKETPRPERNPQREEETAIAAKNNIKPHEQVVYKETNDGFVVVNSVTGELLKDQQVISTKQTPKPVKKKEEDDKNKKQKSEIRQTAIRGTEETLVKPLNRSTHKVKPGETLYSIAKKLNCSVEQLKKWNPEIESNAIQAGDKLDLYI
ncbi:MAG: LysM peptidoglycan-binding domain-containing protein [Bacteroidales bacterium]|nr:LysM peptidoglycan-binding domain-containing protein [Bacteroidales bacterium]